MINSTEEKTEKMFLSQLSKLYKMWTNIKHAYAVARWTLTETQQYTSGCSASLTVGSGSTVIVGLHVTGSMNRQSVEWTGADVTGCLFITQCANGKQLICLIWKFTSNSLYIFIAKSHHNLLVDSYFIIIYFCYIKTVLIQSLL